MSASDEDVVWALVADVKHLEQSWSDDDEQKDAQ